MVNRREFLRNTPVAVVPVATLLGCTQSRAQLPPPPMTAARPSEIRGTLAEALASERVGPAGQVTRPQNILLLSGGGQYASYNAGALVGWTASGTRPTFDVVTGISSGALVALFAFLGPAYDDRLRHLFTTITDQDVYRYRPVVGLIRNSALVDTARLERLIEREVNEQFLCDLRAAHAAGRRLYLGTMNVQTRRQSVWDLGAIASSGRPDAALLVRKVVQATAAIPGLMPAVTFDVDVDGRRYEEEHVDGGAVSQTFLRLGPGGARPSAHSGAWLKGSNLYVMAAGKLYVDPLTEKPGLLKRATGSLSAALYALFRAEVVGLYAFCGVSGMKFHLAAIGQDVPAPSNSFTFQPDEMKRLFAVGYGEGVGGGKWRLTPPGADPGEEAFPRDGSGVTVPAKN